MSLEIKGTINQYMVATDPNSREAANSIAYLAQRIESNELSLLNFVKLLGDYLTDDSNTIRPKSLSLLSSTLSKVSKDKIIAKDVDILVGFYISKLDDPQCTKETLKGLDALVSMKNFRSSLIEKVLLNFIEKYKTSGQLASTRYFGFLILQTLLTNPTKLEICKKSLNDLTIKSFLSIAKNEKDPRNLMISFELNKLISKTFKIDQFSEDMFDSVFCYFPISFRAPENDPYKITGDQLKQALRSCLSANSLYAKDALPNLVEKLASTSPTVKLDVLNTINQCINEYDVKTIEEYWISLWNALKFEILHNEIANAEDLNALLNYYKKAESEDERVIPFVFEIFQSLSNRYTGVEEGIRDYLILIVDELSKFLKDPEDSKSKQSALIMAGICSANANSFNLLIDKTLKLLITPINDPEQLFTIKKQRLLLTNVSFLLDAYYKLFNEDNLFVEFNNPIFEHKDIILTMLNQSLLSTSKVEVTLRCLAIKLIGKLFRLKSFLQDQECQLLVQTLTEVILDDDNINTFNQALASLSTIAKGHPEIILEYTIPKLLTLLPDNDLDQVQDLNSHITNEKIFEIFLAIAENRLIINSLTIRLLNKLESVLISSGSQKYSRELLLTISNVLNKLGDNDSTNDSLKKFVPRFLSLILENTACNVNSVIYQDPITLDYSGKILKKIITDSDSSLHQDLNNNIYDILVKGQTKNDLLLKELPQPISVTKSNFILISIFGDVIASLDRSVKFPTNPTDFVEQLIEISENETTVIERQSTLQTIALIINKWFTNTDSDYLEKKYDTLTRQITSVSTPTSEKLKSLELFTWISKSLLLKDDKLVSKYQEFLISLLDEQKFSLIAPKCLAIVIADAPCFEVYKKTGPFGKSIIYNLNVRLLYKQKFFDSLLPILITKFKSSNKQHENYLTALSLILKYIDKQVVIPHLQSILPLILTSLSLNSSLIVSSSLTILKIAIIESPNLIERQLDNIIPNMIRLLNSKEMDYEEVKYKSLECLMTMTGFELHLIVPFRQEIINGLALVLDDNKRKVRRLACDCREVYYELGQPKAE